MTGNETGNDPNSANSSRFNPQYIGVFIIAIAMIAGFAVSASGATVDGFEVTFNALPTAALSQGLPISLSINGTDYAPADLVYPVAGGIGGFSHQSSNPWGATSPFQYSPSLNGSVYDGIWNGAATYSFNEPQTSFSILWGTIGGSDALRFYGTNGDVIGTIYGADLEPAAATNFPGYQWANGVYITVQLTNTPFSSVSVIGSPNLTFEYANISTAPPTPPHLTIESDGKGGYFIRFTGVPGARYRLERASNPNGPWSSTAPQTAPPSGLVEFWDFLPPVDRAFYRTVRS